MAEEVQLQKDTHKILDVFAQNAYKEKLKEIDAKLENNSQEAKTISFTERMAKSRIYSIAAVILLLIATSYIWLSVNLNPARIAEDAYEPYPNILTVKGDNNIDQLLQDGVRAYKAEDFDKAISSLEEVLKADPDEKNAAFYLGLTKISNNQSEEAIPLLKIAKSSPKFEAITDWFIGLAHLKSGNTEEAKTIFEVIANDPANDKQKEAQEILGKLDSFWKFLPGVG